MKPPKLKTQVDHWLSLPPEEQLRRNRKHYQHQRILRMHEINARQNMTKAQAWADTYGKEPLPQDPDNLEPKGLTYEERSKHSYYELITDPDEIRDRQQANTEHRLAYEKSKRTTKTYSIAKHLENGE